jgi:hypothetical protein
MMQRARVARSGRGTAVAAARRVLIAAGADLRLTHRRAIDFGTAKSTSCRCR